MRKGLLSLREDLERLSEHSRIQLTGVRLEINNLVTIGSLIAESALAREESRGAHFRNDFPKRDDERFARHSVVQASGRGRGRFLDRRVL